MSRVRFEKSCAAVPARVIERAVRHLLSEGYGLKEQSENQAMLVFMRGNATATSLEHTRHELEIVSDGKSLTFDFHSLLGASGYVTKKERKHLEERADQTVIAAGDPKPPPIPVDDEKDSFRCRYCSHLTPLSESRCQSCGADNFI